MNELRIRGLLVILACAFTALVLALARLSIVDHEIWRARAGQNHTSFLGLESRRGSILFNDGRVVAVDEQGFDIEFEFRRFRREHPVGAAVHGANLLRHAAGVVDWDSERAYDFSSPERVVEAFELLCEVDVTMLSEASQSAVLLARLPRYRFRGSVEQDLRFYLASLLSGLTDRSFAEWILSLRSAADRSEERVTKALAKDLRQALGLPGESPEALRRELRGRFRERATQFFELAGQLDELHAREQERRGFEPSWSFLEELEEARKGAENRADLRGLDPELVDAVETGDFWRFLAKRGSRPGSVRALLGRSDDEIEALVDRVVEERRQGEERLVERLQGLTAELEDGLRSKSDIKADLRRNGLRQLYGIFVFDDEDESFEQYSGPPILDEHRPIPLLRRVPYAFATRIKLDSVRHPGFRVHDSVRRVRAEDLGGLGPYIGSVSRYSLDDRLSARRTGEADVEREIDALARQLEQEGILESTGATSDTFVQALWRDLETNFKGHVRRRGRIGRSGVEAAMDEHLRGELGMRHVDRDRRGRESGMHAMADGERGNDVTLTIDPALQQLADSIVSIYGLGAQRALVGVDPQTGDIKFLSGYGPDFERGEGGGLVPIGTTYDLAATKPATDPSVGSVIKPMVALELLDGLRERRYAVGPQRFEACVHSPPDGSFYERISRSQSFGCDHHHGDASQNVVDALAYSCNIFFYEAWRYTSSGSPAGDEASEWVGSAMAERLDWRDGRQPGQIVGLDDPLHVTPHLMPKRTVRGKVYGRSEMVRTIGYDWSVSALDMAHAYAMVSTGRRTRLGLVLERDRRSVPVGWHRDDLELVHEGLRQCLRIGTGKAWRGRFGGLGLLDQAYVKTGTAFVGYRDRERRRDEIYNAWFAMFLGTFDDARIAIVSVAYGTDGTGSEDAAPMVVDLLERMAADDQLRHRYLEWPR